MAEPSSPSLEEPAEPEGHEPWQPPAPLAHHHDDHDDDDDDNADDRDSDHGETQVPRAFEGDSCGVRRKKSSNQEHHDQEIVVVKEEGEDGSIFGAGPHGGESRVPEMPMEFYEDVDRFLALPPPSFTTLTPAATTQPRRVKPGPAAPTHGSSLSSSPALPSISHRPPSKTLSIPVTKRQPAAGGPHALDEALLAEAFAYVDRLAQEQLLEEEEAEENGEGRVRQAKGRMKKTRSQPSTQMMFAVTKAGPTFKPAAGIHSAALTRHHPTTSTATTTTSRDTMGNHQTHHIRRISDPIPRKSSSSSSLVSHHRKPRGTNVITRQSTINTAMRKQQLARSHKALVHRPPPPLAAAAAGGGGGWTVGMDRHTDKNTGMRQEELQRMVNGFESQVNIQQLRRELEESQASMERSEAVLRSAAQSFYDHDYRKAMGLVD